MIKLVPLEGLCNRMRAIDSAIALADDLNEPLEVYWVKDNGMKHNFYDLFEPIQHNSVKIHYSNKAPLMLKKSIKKNFHLPLLIRKIFSYITFERDENTRLLAYDFAKTSSQNIVIRSFSRFYNNPKMYQLFVPIQEVREKIKHRSQAFNEFTIGVHIRRTDNSKSINASPLYLFEEAMQKEIEKEPRANFYLATDCEDTKSHFKKLFSGKIITAEEAATRDDVEGIRDAMVELYCLSKTQKVFGSYWSSFSHTACHIGNIPEITLTINK